MFPPLTSDPDAAKTAGRCCRDHVVSISAKVGRIKEIDLSTHVLKWIAVLRIAAK